MWKPKISEGGIKKKKKRIDDSRDETKTKDVKNNLESFTRPHAFYLLLCPFAIFLLRGSNHFLTVRL